MSATSTIANGRPQRKLLSEQLDRLDSVIDGLCDGLPEAIAAAAREGTRAAVKDAILEIVSNPELRGLLQNSAMVPPPAPAPSEPVVTGPSLWTRIKTKLAAAKAAVVEQVRVAKILVVHAARTFAAVVPVKPIVIIAGVAVLGGVAIHIAPAGFTATIAVAAGAVGAGLLQLGNWLRRSARVLTATG
jgi:hypothetical protein